MTGLSGIIPGAMYLVNGNVLTRGGGPTIPILARGVTTTSALLLIK
jgi:hypothetical protein